MCLIQSKSFIKQYNNKQQNKSKKRNMELKEAIEIIKEHNLWRKGNDKKMIRPSIISLAIDTIVNHYENYYYTSTGKRYKLRKDDCNKEVENGV